MRFCYFLWALSVTCGILFFNFIFLKKYNINFFYILLFILFTAVLLAAVFVSKKKYPNLKNIKILFLFITILMLFSAGLMSTDYNNKNVNEFSFLATKNNIFKYSDVGISSMGRITCSPYKKFNNTYFDLKITKLEIFNKESNKSVLLEDCGNIFIKHKGEISNELRLNDLIKLNIKDIQAYTNNRGNISCIFLADNILEIKDQSYVSYFNNFKSKIYDCLNYLFFTNLRHENAELASAFILGNQAEVSMEISESFKKSGIYHLLSISGLHISLIALFLSRVLRKMCPSLRSGKIIIACIIVLFLIFYNFMVGEKASMLRASIMFCLVFFSRDLFKDYKQENVLLISYTVLILANPDFLTDIGFILSFASVAALTYIVPLVRNCLFYFQNNKNAVNNYFIKSIIAAFSINMFILPILSYYYGGFSLISILTNLASAPVFYILLLDLFISSVAAVVWFPLGSCLITPANFLMNIIIALSEFFNSLPYAFIKTEIFKNKTLISLYYFSLIIVFVLISLFLKKKRKE